MYYIYIRMLQGGGAPRFDSKVGANSSKKTRTYGRYIYSIHGVKNQHN